MKAGSDIFDAEDDAGYKLLLCQHFMADDKEKALLLAGWLLDQMDITGVAFSEAVNVLLWATTDQASWVERVEQVWARLKPSERKAQRDLMLLFYGVSGSHERFIKIARHHQLSGSKVGSRDHSARTAAGLSQFLANVA